MKKVIDGFSSIFSLIAMRNPELAIKVGLLINIRNIEDLFFKRFVAANPAKK
jgi:hypothetical protein